MKSRTLRFRPLASAVALACTASSTLLLASHAFGQEAVTDEITVTGTRIQRTSGFTTPVPVTAVTPDELAGFQPGRTMADQLDQLPQFFSTQSAQRGGGALFGAAGISALNMRAMGPQRTLVLLDGARVVPADRDGSVHVDNFPTALLQQVEVVTGGASAAYGADALAGVTNFRINRNYTGFDLNVGAGTTDSGFGDTTDFSAAWGTELGERWHFVGSLENQRIDAINPEPNELGDWFQRYGITGNPNWVNASSNATEPQRIIRPDLHSTVHTPTGRIGAGANAAGAPVAFTLNGMNFNYTGTAVQPFQPGNIVSTATQTQSGGPEAAIADAAFNGPVYGAEVLRENVFAGLTFDANDTTQFTMNAYMGETQSNDDNQRGIPHLSGIWNGRIFVTNPFLPADVRNAMIAQGVDSFTFQKQGTVLGQSGNWNDDENRHNQFDFWTVQLGLDKDIGETWNMQARLQRGESDRFTTVYNEVRVDREFLALDAVEVVPGTTTLVTEAQRGTGQIICNVQRYNPTPAQLQDAVDGFPGDPTATPPLPPRPPVLAPSVQGDYTLGGPTELVQIPGPVGPDAIPNCVPMNAFGQGNVSPQAQAYLTSPKQGVGTVTQEFAEILFTGDIWEGYGPGAFSIATGLTYRDQKFWQRGEPFEIEIYGPPRNAPEIGIRGIATTGFENGSANLHEFSTVPAIGGDYDVWELFTEFNLPLWQSESGNQRFELDVAGRHSDYSTSGGIVSHKTGISFQVSEAWRLRATSSRDVREPTFAERFNLQGGGGSVTDPNFPGQPAFQITVTMGGNPDLEPEEADTLTAGFVYQPPGSRPAVVGRLVRHQARRRRRSRRPAKHRERVRRGQSGALQFDHSRSSDGDHRQHSRRVPEHRRGARSRYRLRARVRRGARPVQQPGRDAELPITRRPAPRGQHYTARRQRAGRHRHRRPLLRARHEAARECSLSSRFVRGEPTTALHTGDDARRRLVDRAVVGAVGAGHDRRHVAHGRVHDRRQHGRSRSRIRI